MYSLSELLYPQDLDLSFSDREWWVAHLKVHQEFKLAKELAVENVPHFLPLIEKQNRSSSRRRTRIAPLFPSYFFFAGGDDERKSVLRTGRTARVISVLDQERLRYELNQILHTVRSGVKVDPFEGLKAGKPCRITSGAAMGLVGKIVRRSKKTKVAIEVTSVGQGFMMEVDANDIELLDENSHAN